MPVQKLLPFMLFLCSQIMCLPSALHFSSECDRWVIRCCQEANIVRPKINLLDHNSTGIFILVEYKCVYILTTVFQTFARLLMACLPIRRPVSTFCPALPHPIKAIGHQRAGAFTVQTYCKTTSWSHACYQQLTHFVKSTVERGGKASSFADYGSLFDAHKCLMTAVKVSLCVCV